MAVKMRMHAEPEHKPLILQRLRERVIIDENGCHIFQGSLNHDGYGVFEVAGIRWGAHRAAYIVSKGDIPDGLRLDHLCRVRNCCNPDHLEPVTQAENTRRGLMPKVTLEQVKEIRASKEKSGVLGKRYGVAPDTIKDIRNGRNWKWAL